MRVQSSVEREDHAAVLRFAFGRPRLSETPLGLRVDLPDCPPRGPVGAPALPRRLVHVAVPR